MRKFTDILTGVFLIIFLFSAGPAYSQYNHLYNHYLREGIAALKRGEHLKALFYFDTANGIRPNNDEVRKYLNLIKRIKEGKIQGYIEQKTEIQKKKRYPDVEIVSFKKKSKKARFVPEKDLYAKKAKRSKLVTPDGQEFVPLSTLELDENLWQLQPNTLLEIGINKSIILKGKNISQYLVIRPTYAKVEKIDSDNIKVTMLVRDVTLFHVWDGRGRWTFNLRGVIPLQPKARQRELFQEIGEEFVDPFIFGYSTTWNGNYTGNSLDNLKENNVTFTQWLGIEGETPYGQVYGSVNYYKFEDTTERVGERVGLVDGNIGPFENFTIRGFDTEKTFSELSMPGRSFRGFLLDAYAFNKNLSYSVLQGQDRAQFLFISPGAFEERKSFVEGAQMTLFPEGDYSMSFNYARGYGEARAANLKDRVFSIVSKNRWDKFHLNAELGYDEDAFGKLGGVSFRGTNHQFNFNFRDIENDYVTVTGTPAGQGEIGGILDFDWFRGRLRFNTNLDIYRDRQLPNPDSPDSVNIEGRSRISFPVGKTVNWTTSVFYTDTPQLISPSRTISINNNLSKTFQMWQSRNLITYLGQTYQRSRFDESSTSEYDRFILAAGVRFHLSRNLSYFANYDYGWVQDKFNDTTSNPHVLSTGFSYTTKLTKYLSGSWRLSYRNEEESDGNFSFLAGEDSLRGSLGLSYRPNSDLEVYCDAGVRNVWSESPDNPAFNEADVRMGMRSSWDLIFRWNPTGTIEGYVFKDKNSNGLKEYNEVGVEGIKVKIGQKIVETKSDGKYTIQIKAKRVLVKLDLDSVPRGFILTNNAVKEIWIKHKEKYWQDFGLNVQSGIYGVFFVDKNQNGSYDANEKTILNAHLTLDGKKSVYSDFEGIFNFENVTPGRHTIRIDVNSLPMEYIPLIKIKKKINVLEGTTCIFNVPLREDVE